MPFAVPISGELGQVGKTSSPKIRQNFGKEPHLGSICAVSNFSSPTSDDVPRTLCDALAKFHSASYGWAMTLPEWQRRD